MIELVEVYRYLPAEEVPNVVECGLKLTKWYDRTIIADGQKNLYISALLNPKDDMAKYCSDNFKCVRLEVPSKYCHVADKSLYLAGQRNPEIMNLYYKTLIPVEQYIFGSYRKPECLINTTIIYSQISELNKGLGSPVLYNNSEELYLNNIVESLKEEHDNFNDAILYYLYDSLVKEGKYRKVESADSNLAVFNDNRTDKFYIIKKPDLKKY